MATSTDVEIMSDEKVGEGHRKKSWGTHFHGNHHVVMATKNCFYGQIWAVIKCKIVCDIAIQDVTSPMA